MSKKIISIILTIAMILCQGTLCLGTVSAQDVIYIVDPEVYDIPLDASKWTACQTGTSVSNDSDGNLVFENEAYLNKNSKYESGWMELRDINIDVTSYYAIELTVLVESSKVLPSPSVDVNGSNNTKPQFYYKGIKGDGSSVNVSEANSTGDSLGKYRVEGDNSTGYYSNTYEIYSCEIPGSWSEMSTLTTLRFDALKNSYGKATIKSIRLIGVPGIASVTYNDSYEADLTEMVMNPETIEVNFTSSLTSVDGGVTITDSNGKDVQLEKASVSGSKVVLTLPKGFEFTPFEEYTVTFDRNTKITATKSLSDPITFSFVAGDFRALSIMDIMDPNRPDDTIPEGQKVWNLEFKNQQDIDTYFPTKPNEVTTELVCDEYMKYVTTDLGTGTSGGRASYFIDSPFNNYEITAGRYYKLQIRLKVVEQTKKANAKNDGCFKMYYSDAEKNVKKAEGNADGINYEFTTDENGRYCTDWSIIEVDLSSLEHWNKAQTINSIRFDFLHDAAGEVWVDYIRFLESDMPAIDHLTYNNMEAIDPDVPMPINPDTIDVYLTSPLYSVDKSAVEIVDEFGDTVNINKAEIALVDEARAVVITIGEDLTPNANYTLTIKESAKLTAIEELGDDITYNFSTGSHKAPTIFDIIDPDRPEDANVLPANVYKSWEFNENAESDIAYFPSTSDGKYTTELVYGEYMKIKFANPYLNNNNNWAGYYSDTNLSKETFKAKEVNKLQIRMKVINDTSDVTDPAFRLYFAGTKEDGSTFKMNNDNGYIDSSMYVMKYDEEGNYCTDWFTLEVDLSKHKTWPEADVITSVRICVMENCGGEALVDYIRFIGHAQPQISKASYVADGVSVEITNGTYVPTKASQIKIELTSPIDSLNDEDMVFSDEHGLKYTSVESTVDVTKTIVTVNIPEELDKSTGYTISFRPILVGNIKAVNLLNIAFNTELKDINADVNYTNKPGKVQYRNNTDKSVILVAITTKWKGDKFIDKNMQVVDVSANSSGDFALDNITLADNETAEIVVWQYDLSTDNYTVVTNKVVFATSANK